MAGAYSIGISVVIGFGPSVLQEFSGMCGIAGSIRWDGSDDKAAVAAMTAALAHRGPDADGVIVSGPVVLGHRRLAVIDTAHAADQPMTAADGDAWIVFNGEIYNFQLLRRQLEDKGVVFRTRSDTEVLLHGLLIHGTDFIDRLQGMFAFAFWDRRYRRLILARDRLGKKPLYFHAGKGGLAFASELTALQRHPDCTHLGLSPTALGHYLALGYTTTGACIVSGVEKLAPGMFMVIEADGRIRQHRYWDLAARFRDKTTLGHDQAVEQLGELLDEAVRCRMISDVPLGAFLSGGVDSAALVEAMGRQVGADRVRTFTIGFQEKTFCEADAAADSARRLNVSNLRQDAGTDMAASLGRIIGFTDEPFADTSMIPFFHLSAFARQSVTVALSGDGGDELFAGYVTYVADKMHRISRHMPSFLGAALSVGARWALPPGFGKVGLDYKVKQFLAGAGLSPQRAHYSWRTLFSPAERQRLVRPEHRVVAECDPFDAFAVHFDEVKDLHWLDQALYVDVKTWLADDILVKADRMSMAHSLEVRAPLLDYRLMEFAASLPPDWKLRGFEKKHLLRSLMRKRFPHVLTRPKAGFNAPVSHWLAGDIHDLARAATTSPAMHDMLVPDEIERLWQEHMTKRQDHGFRLFALTCLGLWLEKNRAATPIIG